MKIFRFSLVGQPRYLPCKNGKTSAGGASEHGPGTKSGQVLGAASVSGFDVVVVTGLNQNNICFL